MDRLAEINRTKVYVVSYAAKGPGSEGITTERFWDSLKRGKSGITLLEPQDAFEGCKVNFGGQLHPYDSSVIGTSDQKRNHPVTILSGTLSHEATSMAGLLGSDGLIKVENEEERYKIGSLIGSATSGTPHIAEVQNTIRDRGEERVGPLENLKILPERPAVFPCKLLGIKGISFLPVLACASGAVSIGLGVDYIRLGKLSMALTGGVETPFASVVQAHLSKALFTNMGALARLNREINFDSKNMSPNTDPTKISCPFAPADKRFGFVMSEGGAVLLLASAETVIKKGLNPIAEVAGSAVTNDAYHDTMTNGIGAKYSMKLALENAGLIPQEVEYLNAHATSTLGDEKEIWAIREVFGDYAPRLSISAAKSMHGHLTGASGGVGGWECVMAMKDGYIIPTINLENGSIAPDLDLTPNVGRHRRVGVAMVNALGFGGGNATVIFREARLPKWI